MDPITPDSRPDPAAVGALVAVTSAGAGSTASLEDILAGAAAAAGARRAVLWAPCPVTGGELLVGPAGGAPADGLADALAPLAGAGLPEDEVALPAASAGEPLSAALDALDASAGVAVPVPMGDVVGGVLLLDCPGWGGLDPLRRHAVRVAAARVGGVIEARRLRRDLERSMEQILLTDERMLGRMGLDIHDGPTQQLSVALLEVQLLEAELADAQASGQPAPATLGPALSRIYETVGGALHEMRELIGHLRPAQFEDRRLSDILQDAIAAFERRTDCEVEATWSGEFPVNGVSITQRITLYRILQETLANAHRHGGAERVRVAVTEDPAGIGMEVADDGVGFDMDDTSAADRPGARFGLAGMRDRVQVLGGSFAVLSEPGSGTTVRVFLPRWRGSEPAG